MAAKKRRRRSKKGSKTLAARVKRLEIITRPLAKSRAAARKEAKLQAQYG